MNQSNLKRMLDAACGEAQATELMQLMNVSPELLATEGQRVSRAEIAQALNMVLFAGILERVPTGMAYTRDVIEAGGKVVFDHGALRTVKWESGALPAGEIAFTRILVPLGYKLNGEYPLDRIGMTGRSYAHIDFPDDIAQYFVSELHPERFSPAFQQAVTRVLASSVDPLSEEAVTLLARVEREGHLALDEAIRLVPQLAACFERQHGDVALADYELLRGESAEMAWIATEGNAFNHATDRVPDVHALAQAQRELGRPIKDAVEVSRSGRVLQTAFKADPVEREFIDAGGATVRRTVPGSFYEFITRDFVPASEAGRRSLDLSFDAGNAQGIFKMTAAC
ncbi:2-oxoadipate dioxygenase/decarboxylase family protein [Paracidovorax citrulli]